MKIFCFIFSLYLLLLSVQPCADFAISEPAFAQTENAQTNLRKHEKQDDCEDHECSPFCICSCRQVSTKDNFSAFELTKEIIYTAKETPKIEIQDFYSNQYLDSIWQPPKSNSAA